MQARREQVERAEIHNGSNRSHHQEFYEAGSFPIPIHSAFAVWGWIRKPRFFLWRVVVQLITQAKTK
jgi:hypothetical protein